MASCGPVAGSGPVTSSGPEAGSGPVASSGVGRCFFAEGPIPATPQMMIWSWSQKVFTSKNLGGHGFCPPATYGYWQSLVIAV